MKRGPKHNFHSGNACERSLDAWKRERPAWVRELSEACDATSQGKVAKRLGYSASVVSQVIGRVYRGDYDAVEQKVRGALMSEEVSCPVVGEIRKDICANHQKKAKGKFMATSAMRARLNYACRGNCPHSRIGGRADAE